MSDQKSQKKTPKSGEKIGKNARHKSEKPKATDGEQISAKVNESTPDESALPDITKLPAKQQLFIEEYLIDLNGTQAAIRAGYSVKSAGELAVKLMKNPAVKALIDAGIAEKRERIRMTRERVLSDIEDMATADLNELTEFRRVCCRYCWGIDGQPQYTPAEFQNAKQAHEIKRATTLLEAKIDIGEFPVKPGNWLKRSRDPNPECAECDGEGHGEVFFKDTRLASRRARLLYAGAEIGKDGIKVKAYSKEKFMEMLAKTHKLYDDAPQFNMVFEPELLAERFTNAMAKAHERMAEVRKERSVKGSGD